MKNLEDINLFSGNATEMRWVRICHPLQPHNGRRHRVCPVLVRRQRTRPRCSSSIRPTGLATTPPHQRTCPPSRVTYPPSARRRHTRRHHKRTPHNPPRRRQGVPLLLLRQNRDCRPPQPSAPTTPPPLLRLRAHHGLPLALPHDRSLSGP